MPTRKGSILRNRGLRQGTFRPGAAPITDDWLQAGRDALGQARAARDANLQAAAAAWNQGEAARAAAAPPPPNPPRAAASGRAAATPSRPAISLRNRIGSGILGGAVSGALAADELAQIDRDYGGEAMNEAAPGVLARAGGATLGSMVNPQYGDFVERNIARLGNMTRTAAQRAVNTPAADAAAESARAALKTATAEGEAATLGRVGSPSTWWSGIKNVRARGLGPSMRLVGRNAVTTAKGSPGAALRFTGGLARRIPAVMAAAGLAGGAADTYEDWGSGYAEDYARRNGYTGPGGDLARLTENVGNAATLGYSGKLGRAIASALNGEGFIRGWGQEDPREAFYAQRRAEQAAAAGKPPPAGSPAAATAAAGAAALQAHPIRFSDPNNPNDQPPGYTRPPRNYWVDGKGNRHEVTVSPADQRADAAAAALRARTPERAVASGMLDAENSEAAGIRSANRVQGYADNARGAITGNALNGITGDTNELMRRMNIDLTSSQYKGFPSLRAARAEMWNGLINQANGVTAKGADNAATADVQGMTDSNAARRAFSERRSNADMFNVQTAEARRAADMDRNVNFQLGVGRRGATYGAAGTGTGTAAGSRPLSYADEAKGYGTDVSAAADAVLQNRILAGENPQDSALGTMGLNNAQLRLLAGQKEVGDRWFNPNSGPVPTNPLRLHRRPRNWLDTLTSAIPGRTTPSDYLYKDDDGNDVWSPNYMFSPDPQMDEYLRAQVARSEAERQQRQAQR